MEVYLANITRLTYYFFSLNYLNFAWWTPVHIHDTLSLPKMHLDVNQHFQQGQFTENKTGKLFSNICLDHGQEQNMQYSGSLPPTHFQISHFYTLFLDSKLQSLHPFLKTWYHKTMSLEYVTMSKPIRTKACLWNTLNLYAKQILNMGMYY